MCCYYQDYRTETMNGMAIRTLGRRDTAIRAGNPAELI
jgi:hypothetical protein